MTRRGETTRRLFMRVRDAKSLLTDLGREGAFIPTRLNFHLSEHILLTLRLGARGRTLEIPVVVAARRAGGAAKRVSAGVVVRVADPTQAIADLVRALATGDVVDFEERLRAHARTDVQVHFDERDELLREVGFLTHGGVATVPVDCEVHPGDRVKLRLAAVGGPALPSVTAEVRGVILTDNQSIARLALCDNADRERLLAPLARPNRPRLITSR